jgi:putative phosphoribosyl transferase
VVVKEVHVLFRDRADAGRRLAEQLRECHLEGHDMVVLGLPRGGVPVAFEVAKAMSCPLDVIIVRKLGVPHQPELAMGAIGEGGVRIVNQYVQRSSGISEDAFASVERRERAELERRACSYRGEIPPVPLQGRTAVIVDDGIATGSTARAACRVARAHGARKVILAVPVASRASVAELADACDEVVTVETPEWFYGVGEWYRDFHQTSDDQVVALLHRPTGGS